MPGNPALAPQEVADLVNFMLALQSAPADLRSTGADILAPVACPKDRTVR
jgi:hypothetical protein